MSVIIKGMEMPKNCRECNFCSEINFEGYLWFDFYCRAKDKEFDLDKNKDKPNWCPLVEIPTPHGRLIDADAIDYRNDAMHDGRGNLVVEDNFISGIMWINDCIDKTKTIIEEEKDEVVS